MFDLKPISRQAIPAALEKADRYRLLNQPRQAESICLDVLRADPDNSEAQVGLLLSLTDQFQRPAHGVGIKEAQAVLSRLRGDYERLYYEGVVSERWGKALLSGRSSAGAALDWLRHAMERFEQAMRFSPPDNDEAILHWNACARLVTRAEESGAALDAGGEAGFRDDAPPG